MQVGSRTRALILNVNDNEAARYMVTVMLQRAGFAVIEAATGRDAIRSVEENKPDLLVLDVKLPDISGLEVCSLLRQNPALSSLKILHTSATFVTTDSKVRALRGGADGYLTQPFESEELVATIDALLRLTRSEEELRATAERLQEADRRKNEFLAMLAHELRNPLAAIWAALPVMERHQARDAAELKARNVLERQCRQLKRLIDDLLDVARVTQGKIELRSDVVELSRLLTQVAENARRTCVERRQQQLSVSSGAQQVFVRGDAVRLEQVITNLLDNASKYTPERGHIEVELSTLVGAQGEPRVAIEVRDDGIGMDPQTLPEVFSLFAQANVPLARQSGGLGIGLTLVRRLVELHLGTVSAASGGLGQGSTFRVELPVVVGERAGLSVAPEAARRQATSAGKRVLVVDDNTDLQELLAEQLKAWGYEVECASDGAAGLMKALELRPDVALVDIGLPGMDGYQVAQRIRQEAQAKELSLIAITGYGASEKRERALECGFDQVLVKPVEAERLRALLSDPPRRVSGDQAQTANHAAPRAAGPRSR